MKNIYSITAVLFLTLLSVSFVSAIVTTGPQVELILKPDSGIKMNVLESYCLVDSCKIESENDVKTISFKINYQEHNLIISAKENKNSGLFSLQVVDLKINSDVSSFKSSVSAGLELLINKDIIYGLESSDLENIKTLIGTGGLIYYKSPQCGDSFFNSIGEPYSDMGKSGWLSFDLSGCEFNKYENTCSRIDCSATYVPGELMVGFKDGTSLTDAQDLIVNLGLSSEEKVSSLWDVQEWLLVLVPEGEEKEWISKLENEDIIDYTEFNGIVGAAATSKTTPDLENFKPLTFEESNNLIYWILGIVIIVVVILFLIFKKKH